MIQLLRDPSSRRSDLVLATAGIVLPEIAALAVVIGAPSVVRFVAVLGAVLYGPATPALRLTCRIPWFECLALGIGVDAALVMLSAQAMVMANQWAPGPALAGLLVASVVVAVPLLLRSTGQWQEQKP